MDPKISVFTKPWKTLPANELCQTVKRLGFDGMELPVRPGCQVEPGDAMTGLPALAKLANEHGLRIMSVAAEPTEAICEACAVAGVPLIRIMLGADPHKNYLDCEDEWIARLRTADALCAQYGVKLGVQPHYGAGVSGTMELRHVLERADCGRVGAIWDAAHSALAGELPEQALDIIWDQLLLVNLKTAYYRREAAADGARFEPYFTTGLDGASDWRRIVAYLSRRGYQGDICMPAEYTDRERELDFIGQDLALVRQMLSTEQ